MTATSRRDGVKTKVRWVDSSTTTEPMLTLSGRRGSRLGTVVVVVVVNSGDKRSDGASPGTGVVESEIGEVVGGRGRGGDGHGIAGNGLGGRGLGTGPVANECNGPEAERHAGDRDPSGGGETTHVIRG